LRERRDDIHPLALHFLSRANQAHQRNVHLTPEALALLDAHPWPGNIRELGNVIERLVLLADQAAVGPDELANYLGQSDTAASLAAAAAPPTTPPPVRHSPPANWTAAPLVREYQPAHSHTVDQLSQVLTQHGGNQSRAAQSLGLTLRQFAYRLKKAGLR
jgi:Nif-specific regulatory protein